jgi:hypothetical protein
VTVGMRGLLHEAWLAPLFTTRTCVPHAPQSHEARENRVVSLRANDAFESPSGKSLSSTNRVTMSPVSRIPLLPQGDTDCDELLSLLLLLLSPLLLSPLLLLPLCDDDEEDDVTLERHRTLTVGATTAVW